MTGVDHHCFFHCDVLIYYLDYFEIYYFLPNSALISFETIFKLYLILFNIFIWLTSLSVDLKKFVLCIDFKSLGERELISFTERKIEFDSVSIDGFGLLFSGGGMLFT